jgi:hypothetical protein
MADLSPSFFFWMIVTCINDYRRVLGWKIGFIDTLYIELGTTGNYSLTADLHTLQFSVTHALGFSVFNIRILVTDLWQFHCHFISHMKSSLQSIICFLPLFCNCQFRRLDSIQFLCSPSRLTSRDSTNSSQLNFSL